MSLAAERLEDVLVGREFNGPLSLLLDQVVEMKERCGQQLAELRRRGEAA